MATVLPRDLVRRLEQQREQARALSDLLAAHARDVMMAGAQMEALAATQLVRSHVEAAITQYEHALREAGAER